MIGHLVAKPSKERILETINQAAKIEFDFLLNGLNVDSIGIDPQDVIQLIDRKTKALKNKLFGYYDDGKQVSNQPENSNADESNPMNEEQYSTQYTENHQKITFDEDF